MWAWGYFATLACWISSDTTVTVQILYRQLLTFLYRQFRNFTKCVNIVYRLSWTLSVLQAVFRTLQGSRICICPSSQYTLQTITVKAQLPASLCSTSSPTWCTSRCSCVPYMYSVLSMAIHVLFLYYSFHFFIYILSRSYTSGNLILYCFMPLCVLPPFHTWVMFSFLLVCNLQ